MSVRLVNISKSFGNHPVIRDVSLDIADGEFAVFVGPSGCGKSTLLRMIAGLEEATSGELWIAGRRCDDVAPRERGIAMVFQNYALYPHMTVAENIGFGLKMAGTPKAERKRIVAEAAQLLQIEPLLGRKPAQLSGGQRQRVAIGRAIVRKPSVFLFDEPLSNLDAALRVDMRVEIARLHQRLGATMIYVTHDQVEAMTLADKIVVLDRGVVQQVGAPMDLYEKPANTFVAGFIGSPRMNLLPVTVDAVEQSRLSVSGPAIGSVAIPAVPAGHGVGEALTLGLRPHHLDLADDGLLRGRVELVEHLGNETVVTVKTDTTSVVAVVDGRSGAHVGATVSLTFQPELARLFDGQGQALGR